MELFYCPSLLGRAATARRSDAPRRRVQRATEHACCRRLMLSCRAADLSCWTCKTWFEWNLWSACACASRAANVPVQRLCTGTVGMRRMRRPAPTTVIMFVRIMYVFLSNTNWYISTYLAKNTCKYELYTYNIRTCSYMIRTCSYHIRTCSYLILTCSYMILTC